MLQAFSDVSFQLQPYSVTAGYFHPKAKQRALILVVESVAPDRFIQGSNYTYAKRRHAREGGTLPVLFLDMHVLI
jgi:hypothetical protein